MCINFLPASPAAVASLDMSPPTFDYPAETYPGYIAPVVVGGQQPEWRESRFGLIPPWANDIRAGRNTCNARMETMATKPSFRHAVKQRQFALVPLSAFFEPLYDETGRSTRWKIHQQNDEPFTVAALWEMWTSPEARHRLHTFTLITRNCEQDAVLGRFHKPGDEKRGIIIVPPEYRETWLNGVEPCEAASFLQELESPVLGTVAAPRPPKLSQMVLQTALFDE